MQRFKNTRTITTKKETTMDLGTLLLGHSHLPSQHVAVQTAPFTDQEQMLYGYSLAAAQTNGEAAGYFIIADGMTAHAEVPDGFQGIIKATASVTKAVEYFTALAAYVLGNDENDENDDNVNILEQQGKVINLGKYSGAENPFKYRLLATLRGKGLTADPALLEEALQGYAHALHNLILKEEERDLARQLTKKPEQLQSQLIPKRGLRLAAGLLVGDRLSYLTVGDTGIYQLAATDVLMVSESGTQLESNVKEYLGKSSGPKAEIKTVDLQKCTVYFSCNRMLRQLIPENIDFSLLRKMSHSPLTEITEQWYQQLMNTIKNPYYKKHSITTFMVK